MDKETRNTLRNVVTECRRLLEGAISDVLEGQYGIYASGKVENVGRLSHLDAEEHAARERLVVHLEHIRAGGFAPADAVDQFKREIAFTHLNRLAAYKMMEARGLIREAVSRGMRSQGPVLFGGPPGGRAALRWRPASGRLPAIPGLAGGAVRRRDHGALCPA